MTQYLYIKDEHMHVLRDEDSKSTSRFICDPFQFSSLACRNAFVDKGAEVCSYNFIGDYSKLEPNAVLEKMRQIPVNNFGGWREMTDADLAVITLSNTPLKDIYPDLVVMHPAYRAGILYHSTYVSVIPTMGILKSIYDIRQFIDETGKPQIAKFKHYFRLASPKETFDTLDAMRIGINGAVKLTKLRSRMLCLITAWGVAGTAFKDEEELLKKPCAFLHREYFSYKNAFEKTYDEDTAHGLSVWKVSQRFATFIWKTYLSAIGLGKFEPERFFKRQDEVDGYFKYVKSLDEQPKEASSEV